MRKNSDTPKVCEVCRFASEIRTTEDMLCSYKGVVDKEFSCRKFVYDPLKRVPKRLPDIIVPDDIE